MCIRDSSTEGNALRAAGAGAARKPCAARIANGDGSLNETPYVQGPLACHRTASTGARGNTS
eukprot:411190-Alexandrium_andersonii.AAC.1